nr:uncharacterized protein LOC109157263 [Ipomoea batatas]
MLMMGVTDAIIYRTFFSTLSMRAVEWFKLLEPSSVGSFSELAKLFIQKWATSKTVNSHLTHLNGIRQSNGESLFEFLTRISSYIRLGPMKRHFLESSITKMRERLTRLKDERRQDPIVDISDLIRSKGTDRQEDAVGLLFIRLLTNLRATSFYNQSLPYHRNRGHDMEECHTLRKGIEELLHLGELIQFVKKDARNSSYLGFL